jgi:hypothetical protein
MMDVQAKPMAFSSESRSSQISSEYRRRTLSSGLHKAASAMIEAPSRDVSALALEAFGGRTLQEEIVEHSLPAAS